MGKQLVEIDSDLLETVRETLGTGSPAETVAQALKEAALAYQARRLISEDLESLIPAPSGSGIPS